MKITTDLIVDAARVTRDIYVRNAAKLITRHPSSAMGEAKRALLMEELAGDEHLCEMLAGRIHQLSSGTLKDD